MSKYLREVMFFIKQQHEWLVDLQSVLAEKEQKNNIFYNKLNYQLKKEMKSERLVSYAKRKKQLYEDENVYLEYDDDDEVSDVTNCSADDVNKTTKAYPEIVESQEKCLIVKTEILSDEYGFDVKNEAMSDEGNYERELDHEQKFIRTKKQLGNVFKTQSNIDKSHNDSDRASGSNDNVEKTTEEKSDEKKNFNKENNKVKQEILFNEKCENYLNDEEKSVVQTLEEHVESEKPYKCKTCGRGFYHKGNLNQHKRIHTGEKPFECSYCLKKFVQKSTCTRHIRIHTTEKPYNCQICSEKFSYPSYLTSHMKKHTGEKPHKSTICGWKFSVKKHLIEHERVHSGEKPYNCVYCDEKFARKSTLTRHIRTHTGEKPYKCTMCSESFAQQSSLKLHWSRKHNTEEL